MYMVWCCLPPPLVIPPYPHILILPAPLWPVMWNKGGVVGLVTPLVPLWCVGGVWVI